MHSPMGWEWRLCKKLMVWSPEFEKCQMNKIKPAISLQDFSEPLTHSYAMQLGPQSSQCFSDI